MYLDNIKFSKLFKDKHGQDVFNEITLAINKEKANTCNENYIEAIFKVAFMDYFGLDNSGLNNMLKDIKCNSNIKDIKKVHENSIKIIQEYIKNTNSKNNIK